MTEVADQRRVFGVDAATASAKRAKYYLDHPDVLKPRASMPMDDIAKRAADLKAKGLAFVPPDLTKPKVNRRDEETTENSILTDGDAKNSILTDDDANISSPVKETLNVKGKAKIKGKRGANIKSSAATALAANVKVNDNAETELSLFLKQRSRVQLKLDEGSIFITTCHHVLADNNLFLFIDCANFPVPFMPAVGSTLNMTLPSQLNIAVVYMGGYIEVPPLNLAVMHFFVRTEAQQ